MPAAVGQSLRYRISMPYTSIGAYTTKQNDPFSFTGNQAALMQTKTAAIGVFGERRFLLAENSVYGLAATFPSALGNFGLQINYAGFANFNEHQIGAAFAKSLGSHLDIGVQFNYYGYRIPAYNSASSVNFEAGAIVHASEKLNIGVHVYNPVKSSLNKITKDRLPSAFKFGVGYDADSNLYISTELIKEENQAANITGAIQYHFQKQFFMRAGFKSDNSSGFAGIGFMHKNLRLDVSASFHQQLGVSPGLLLIYHFKEESQ